jgi:hypothetical protein
VRETGGCRGGGRVNSTAHGGLTEMEEWGKEMAGRTDKPSINSGKGGW